MTVGELIDRLSEFDDGTPVIVVDSELYEIGPITKLRSLDVGDEDEEYVVVALIVSTTE